MKAHVTEYLEIAEAKHVGEYRIFLLFNDGTKRAMDFGPFLKQATNPIFTQYRVLKKFKSFRLDYGDLMWGDYDMIFPITDLHRGEI